MNLLCNELNEVEWGVHFHNDFGLATANTLAAYEQGATLLQVSFNNLGERCGIASPAEIAATLKYVYREELKIDLAKIRELAYTIEEITGFILNERQPVIGRGLYWYETATPILTMLEQDTHVFELIPAEDNGAERKMTIGKHTSNKLFKLYQEQGIFEKQTSLKTCKQQANLKRERMLPKLRSLIAEYHHAVKNSNLMFSIKEKSSPKNEDKIRENDAHSKAEVAAG
jgi:isopropylmalate/homocitrate/citramalate synthase